MVGIRRENSRAGDPNYIKDTEELPSIEAWLAQKEKFRAVGHGLPLWFPKMESCSPELQRLFQKTLKPKIVSILGKFNINCMLARLGDWRPKGVDEVQHTILISSDDTNTTRWKTTAEEILRVFRHELPLDFTGDAQVEIQNKELMYMDVSRAVPDDPALVKCLRDTQKEVAETVMETLEGCWSSIAYHMRVPLGSSPDTPSRATLLMYCRFGRRGDFKTAEDRILEVLDKAPMDIHLELIPGEICLARSHDRPKYLSHLTKHPVNGSSISVQNNNTEPGSLGRAADRITAAHTDVHGVVPGDPRGRLVAEYPAACDGNHTLNVLTSLPKEEANSLDAGSFGDVKLGDWVSKNGRSSDTTYGRINHLHREVMWPSGERTFEVEVLSLDGEFSRPGDSGSMVVNSKGEFVGLAMATDSSASFITPISHIQRDIHELTNGGYMALKPDDPAWFVDQ
ncbi:hypothetical protein MGYG_02465 [Nannizzia gypsea CBS 118893]|uniref:Uncharacterized protein n=1 Tax=Arthroderma gypseum (strain ATCC MYA-4604 / CBS 118893) TaxID=535722 RepID=E4UMN7_ARTGP|nr:hypothetical protein MGYG_02465 [Nannizzia gypsea CBS 118893]EFQ99454.1 hypothetical protein MGYG_02465 [Nannizzia gypsea CBS 118893]